MAASVLHWLSASDHRLMRRVNRWTPPRWMRLWMVAATRGGDGWLWYGIGRGGGTGWRSRTFPGPIGRGASGKRRHCAVPELEAGLRPQTPLRIGAAFLGHLASAGSILISIGAYHHGIRGGDFDGRVLPGDAARSAVLRVQRRTFPHLIGHALPQRRAGRRCYRQWARLRRCIVAELIGSPYSTSSPCAGWPRKRKVFGY